MALAPVTNRLLAGLPRKDRLRVLASCEPVQLNLADILCEPGERIRHVYFPSASYISLLCPVDDSLSLEVELVGNEGMFGVPLLLGVATSPLHAVVQGAGAALHIDAKSFLRELALSAACAVQPLCLRGARPTRAHSRLHQFSFVGRSCGAARSSWTRT